MQLHINHGASDEINSEPYQLLASAIVEQAIKDYADYLCLKKMYPLYHERRNHTIVRYGQDAYRFITSPDLMMYSDSDYDYILKAAKKVAEGKYQKFVEKEMHENWAEAQEIPKKGKKKNVRSNRK